MQLGVLPAKRLQRLRVWGRGFDQGFTAAENRVQGIAGAFGCCAYGLRDEDVGLKSLRVSLKKTDSGSRWPLYGVNTTPGRLLQRLGEVFTDAPKAVPTIYDLQGYCARLLQRLSIRTAWETKPKQAGQAAKRCFTFPAPDEMHSKI